MFTKVKAVVITFVLAALAGIGPAVTDTDWGSFGSFGPAIGLAVGAVVAYAVKEVKGYGGGVTVPPDQGDAGSGTLPPG